MMRSFCFSSISSFCVALFVFCFFFDFLLFLRFWFNKKPELKDFDFLEDFFDFGTSVVFDGLVVSFLKRYGVSLRNNHQHLSMRESGRLIVDIG